MEIVIGLIGASVGVIVSGIVQYVVFKKQVRIEQQIIAGSKLLERCKEYHYLIAKIKVKHSNFPIDLRINYNKVNVENERSECMKAISEIVMLRRVYCPVIDIPDKNTMELFNQTDYYFSAITNKEFIVQDNAHKILSLKLELIQALNNTLIYDIQNSMYRSITSKKELMEKQNEDIIQPQGIKK
ncbi:MAG TPA: hypothetical protein DHM90_05780 [Clostridiaceae bacterium]|nr:hypothetical protein [Clostridiaceae bacterium]